MVLTILVDVDDLLLKSSSTLAFWRTILVDVNDLLLKLSLSVCSHTLDRSRGRRIQAYENV